MAKNPPSDDPVAVAAAIIDRAMAGGRELTPLEAADLAVQRAYARIDVAAVPCYRCACCQSWVTALELLRAHVDRHRLAVAELGACASGDCMVCHATSWVD